MVFQDRYDAGRQLAPALKSYTHRPDVLVLALPRGGVPVGYEVAQALGAPLDVFLVRKLGMPGQEELALGAIASGGIRVINRSVVDSLDVSEEVIEEVAAREGEELKRREALYRTGSAPAVAGKTVLLVDDGLATGSTMRAAIAALRQQQPAHIVVAVPVGARETCADIGDVADDVVCAVTPDNLRAVGAWYHDFSQTSDGEVRELLHRALAAHSHGN